MTPEPSRLLIMACSQRKRPDPGLLPAIERYNGPQFQVIHKFLREFPDKADTLSVYILSAKFGLISATKPIPNYDYKMSLERGRDLQFQVLNDFKCLLQNGDYNQLFINLGKNYLEAFVGYEQLIPGNVTVIIAKGSQGRRQAELHDWLYEVLPEQAQSQKKTPQSGKAQIRGIEIMLTPEQIYKLAQKSLIADSDKATIFQSWYVQINDQRVGPKWLVSQLTGLPVNSFHTDDARRVLEKLGIEVRRR